MIRTKCGRHITLGEYPHPCLQLVEVVDIYGNAMETLLTQDEINGIRSVPPVPDYWSTRHVTFHQFALLPIELQIRGLGICSTSLASFSPTHMSTELTISQQSMENWKCHEPEFWSYVYLENCINCRQKTFMLRVCHLLRRAMTRLMRSENLNPSSRDFKAWTTDRVEKLTTKRIMSGYIRCLLREMLVDKGVAFGFLEEVRPEWIPLHQRFVGY